MRRALALLLIVVACLLPARVGHAAGGIGLEWHLSLVGAQGAWARGADGRGVSILVIDTGLDKVVATTALSGSVLPGYVAPGLGADPYTDDIGHGTFVACEIACHGATYGYYGIAPRARVAMGKVFGPAGGASDTDVAAAIRWGAVHKFPIISMSLGGSGFSQVEADAVAFAERQGTIVVAAAGNSGQDQSVYPGSFPGVIRVTATDRWDRVTAYSDYGPDVSVAAPGDYIFGVAPMRQTEIDCAGLCVWEGTSMATPLVAGAIADLMSLGYTGPEASAALLRSARTWHLQNPIKYGHGVIDLNAALRALTPKG